MYKRLLRSLLVLGLSVFLLYPEDTGKDPVATHKEPIIFEEPMEIPILWAPLDIDTVEAAPVEEIVEPEVLEYPLTDDEIYLLALVTLAEAEGEPEQGKRMVIDTILNQMDDPRYPNTVSGVIYKKNNFSSMWNGRADRCRDKVTDELIQLVKEELLSRTNSEVLYFRTNYYHSFGTPMFQVGNHYFSK